MNFTCTEISNSHGKLETIQIMRQKAEEIVNSTDAHNFMVEDDIDLGENLTSLDQFYRDWRTRQ